MSTNYFTRIKCGHFLKMRILWLCKTWALIVQIRAHKEVKIREQDTFYRDELNLCAK